MIKVTPSCNLCAKPQKIIMVSAHRINPSLSSNVYMLKKFFTPLTILSGDQFIKKKIENTTINLKCIKNFQDFLFMSVITSVLLAFCHVMETSNNSQH